MRLARSALLVAAAFVAGRPAPASLPDADPWPHLETVRAVLTDPENRLSLSKLTELGPSAAPTLWAVLSGQTSGELDLDRTAGRELARQAIATWPSTEVVENLSQGLPSATPFAERLVMLEFLSWTESEAALPAIFDTLTALDSLQLRSRRIYGALERALEPVLLADERNFYTLIDLLPELPSELLPAVIESIGDLQRPAVVEVLSEIASLGPEFESAVLAEIGSQGQRLSPGAAQDCIQLARKRLVSFDHRQRRLAAVALGRLRDVDSFFDLVTRLGDDDRVVRRVALQALQELSGLRRKWDAKQWTSWWEKEEAWLAGSDELAHDLALGDAYRAGAAVQEIATHRLFAEEVAELLSEGLNHELARTRILTCKSLAGLEHAAAIPFLLEALHDVDKLVRSSAHETLEELTGVDLGADPRNWEDWWRKVN